MIVYAHKMSQSRTGHILIALVVPRVDTLGHGVSVYLETEFNYVGNISCILVYVHVRRLRCPEEKSKF